LGNRNYTISDGILNDSKSTYFQCKTHSRNSIAKTQTSSNFYIKKLFHIKNGNKFKISNKNNSGFMRKSRRYIQKNTKDENLNVPFLNLTESQLQDASRFL